MNICVSGSVAAIQSPTVLRQESGVSSESRFLGKLLNNVRQHTLQTVSFGWRNQLKDRVVEVAEKHMEFGWDGYDATPISDESRIATLRLIERLPENILSPDIVPEATGDLGLEWRHRNDRIFTVSISGRTLVYAGLLGAGHKQHGEEQFFDEIPETVTKILTDHFLKD